MGSQYTCLRDFLYLTIILLRICNTDSQDTNSSDVSTDTSIISTTDDNININMKNHTIPQTWKYSVHILNESSSPVLSFINHTTTYQQIFNPSWIPQSKRVSNAGIIVQLQNCSFKPGECAYCNSTPGLGFTQCNQETGACDPLFASSLHIPYKASIHTNYDPHPSIFYYNNLYYMFADNKQFKEPYLELYTTTDPTNASAKWDLTKSAFPVLITGPASLLPRNLSHSQPNTKHYLFFGGKGYISITNSCLLTSWQHIDSTAWLSPRNGYFDQDGVETGPSPIRLKDGNYLMLYNAYIIPDTDQHNDVTHCEYNIGWVILDEYNPSKILQRSNDALLKATFRYETGDTPFTCTQHNSVYAKALVRINSSSNSSQLFRIYFAGAETSIGTAIISVSYILSNERDTAWLEIAVIVSIGCVVFVILMSVVICCKSDSQSTLHLTTEPTFLSIASAAGHNESYKDISGTNHRGFPYVIGGLDRKKPIHIRTYETNEINPNHIHACSGACYEDDVQCRYLKQYENVHNGLNTSMDSNASSFTRNSCCSHCESNSNSETLRLSQISFGINETLERESE